MPMKVKTKNYWRNMILNKYTKIAAIVVETALIATFIVLAVAVGAKNKQLKQCRQQIAEQTVVIDSLKKQCNELAMLESLHVEVAFQFTQKNVLSFSANNCQNIAKEICYITRGELLDSLKAAKGLKDQM